MGGCLKQLTSASMLGFQPDWFYEDARSESVPVFLPNPFCLSALFNFVILTWLHTEHSVLSNIAEVTPKTGVRGNYFPLGYHFQVSLLQNQGRGAGKRFLFTNILTTNTFPRQ